MTGSAAVTWAIVLVAVAGLAVWLVTVALADRKPFFRHPPGSGSGNPLGL